MFRTRRGGQQAQMSDDDEAEAQRSLEQVFQELRVIQTGVQILSAFLLTLPFTVRFATTTGFQKTAYAISLGAAAIATALVIAPVSYHRCNLGHKPRDGRDGAADVVRIASTLAQAGMAALLVAATASVLLALDIALGPVWATAITAFVTSVYIALWYVLPALHRRE